MAALAAAIGIGWDGDMEDIVRVNLLAGILAAATGYLIALAYFLKPEEFYVKRLRPSPARAVSHRELLLRAYGGAGLVHTSIQAVGFYLAYQNPSAWVWVVLTLIMCPILGSMAYAYFRFERYRKASPDERASRGWGDGVFVLRAPFADSLKTGWAKRVDRIARIALPAVLILAITFMIAYGLFAG